MSRSKRSLFLSLLVVGLAGTAASAGFVTYTDEAAFRAAASLVGTGVVHEIDFETLPDGSPSVDRTLITPDFNYGDQGVIFSSPFPTLRVNGEPGIFELSSQFVDTSARNWIIADLLIPASAVGIFFPGHTTLSLFGADDLLIASEFGGGGGEGFFLGIIADDPILSVVQDRGGSGEIMESFLFTPVPEPATLLLVAVGVLGVVRRSTSGVTS